MRRIFVTGIGTGVGKTVVSAVVAEALRADYWKPVQCGDLDDTDSSRVRALLSNPFSVVHPEAFRLSMPASPHTAAEADGVTISRTALAAPRTERDLVIEGAGGALVPLADGLLLADLAADWQAEVLVVSRTYLGSINHTLLTVEALRARGLAILGIVFNGEENRSGESFILRHTGVPPIGRLSDDRPVTPEIVAGYAGSLRTSLGGSL